MRPSIIRGDPPALLFVCTANVSRSPYAQIRATQLFGDRSVSDSAGIPGTDGWMMDPAMEAELPFEDPLALAHRSQTLTPEILDAADVVLTMEFAHHMRVLDRWPDAAAKVFGLRQFVDGLARGTFVGSPVERIAQVRQAAAPNSMMWDVADPYRRGSRAARACARELDELVLAVGIGLGFEPVPED